MYLRRDSLIKPQLLYWLNCIVLLTPASFGRSASAQPPSITITSIPTYGTTEDVAGVAANIDFSMYKVALYVYVGAWYTKPTFATPDVPIQPSGNWTADITSAPTDINSTRIAAFLIPISAIPPQANGTAVLPNELQTLALASDIVYRGNQERILNFAGYDWLVKESASPIGPGPNLFSGDPADVYVDSEGIHLSIVQRAGLWYSTEVILQASPGYGKYVFHTRGRLDLLDPNMVAGFFTWDDAAPPPHRELDFEFARWGWAADPTNAQFVVQPYDTVGNLTRYRADLSYADSDLTLVMIWSAGSVNFATYYGHHPPGNLPAPSLTSSWSYGGAGVPDHGEEQVRINFWLFQGDPPESGVGDTFIVTDFIYLSPTTPTPTPTSTPSPSPSPSPSLSPTATSSPNSSRDWETFI